MCVELRNLQAVIAVRLKAAVSLNYSGEFRRGLGDGL